MTEIQNSEEKHLTLGMTEEPQKGLMDFPISVKGFVCVLFPRKAPPPLAISKSIRS